MSDRGPYSVCVYDTETDTFLCIDLETNSKAAWVIPELCDDFDRFLPFVVLTPSLDIDIETIMKERVNKLTILNELEKRKKYLVVVPVDRHDNPRFDLVGMSHE